MRLLASGALAVLLLLTAVVGFDMLRLIGRPIPSIPVLANGAVSLPIMAPTGAAPGTHVRPPQRVVAVDGVPVHEGRDVWRHVERVGAGALVRYTLRRPDGSVDEVTLPVPVYTRADFRFRYLPFVVIGLFACAVGAVPLFVRPHLPVARVLFAHVLATSAHFALLLFDFVAGYRFSPWLRGAGLVATATFLHLGVVFPEPMRTAPSALALGYGGAALLFALHLVAFRRVPALAFPVDATQIVFQLAVLAAVSVRLARIARAGTDARVRRQARITLPGPLLLAFQSLMVVAGGWWLGARGPSALTSLLPSLVFFSLLTYAILKHNLFEIDAVVRRGLASAVLLLGAIVAYLGLFALAAQLLGSGAAWVSAMAAAAVLVVVVPSIGPLRRRVETVVESALFPDQRRAREIVHEAVRDLAHLRDGPEVAQLVQTATGRSLGGGTVRLAAGVPHEPLRAVGAAGGGFVLEPGDPVYAALECGEGIDVRSRTRRPAAATAARMQALGADLAVALPPSDRLVGGMLLGPRHDGRLYTADDVALLETMAAQVAIALENARAWEAVQALERRLTSENAYLREEAGLEHDVTHIVGQSTAIRAVVAQLKQVARTDAVVLVHGETGTGKELVVQGLHALSGRRDRVLVKVACAAIPEGLLESELFGHERGAFTGAVARKLGRLEIADGGTIFFDDVDTLPLAIQAKLLRALQEGEVQRLGSNEVRRVDVRVVAATNRDLLAEVRAGRFREDLYYRLNVIPITIPPLRERREDVPALVRHFLAQESARVGRPAPRLGPAVLATLQAYHWPGNIRELRNVVERAVVLSDGPELSLHGTLDAGGTWEPGDSAGDLGHASLAELVRRYKVRLITEALAQSDGNQREAAALLGMHRPSLTRMIRDLEIG